MVRTKHHLITSTKFKVVVSFLLMVLLGQSSMSQEQYPEHYFRAPLDIPLYLAGSFGELRYNHFHSGIDFKTQRKTGLPIKASANGHVSRIKVSPYGFGKTLYMEHPNGFTTVYAHLERFNEEITKLVRRVQEKQEAYDVQLYPNRKRLQFQKGDLIAYSGNSGSSTGPHLHFEIRETASEKPLNPLFFGFDIQDTRDPNIKGIKLYPKGPNSLIYVKFDDQNRKSTLANQEPIHLDVKGSGNNYELEKVQTIKAKGKVGVGVEVYDYHNGSSNQMGIYQLKLFKNGERYYQYSVDEFAFANTRYLNAHIDFAEKVRSGRKYQRCFRLPGNQIPLYNLKNEGYINIAQARNTIKIKASDVHGNVSKLKFPIERLSDESSIAMSKMQQKQKGPVDRMIPYNRAVSYNKKGIRLNFPDHAFYDTIAFRLQVERDQQDAYSPVYKIHDYYTPVHRYYSVSIDGTGVPDQYHSKAYIAFEDKYGQVDAEGGNWTNGFLKTKVRKFGKSYIKVDTLAPEVIFVNSKNAKTLTDEEELSVIIRDEESSIQDYAPTINGQWVLMEYDAKNDLIVFKNADQLEKGNHQLKVKVEDEVGNQTIKTFPFIKK